jgi:RNA polymerase sigma factor (sigma-70 family)
VSEAFPACAIAGAVGGFGFTLNADDGERWATLSELLRVLDLPDGCGAGDAVTVQQLVKDNWDWAADIAHKASHNLPPSFDISDLEQEAYIALWRQAEKFDESRGVPFRGYAYMAVRGAVLMSVRRRNYTASTADELAGDYADYWPSPEIELLDQEDRERVRWRDSKRRKRVLGLMEQLPQFEQFLIKRAYLDGDALEDLAEVWGMDAMLLKKRLRCGVRMLSKLRVMN